MKEPNETGINVEIEVSSNILSNKIKVSAHAFAEAVIFTHNAICKAGIDTSSEDYTKAMHYCIDSLQEVYLGHLSGKKQIKVVKKAMSIVATATTAHLAEASL